MCAVYATQRSANKMPSTMQCHPPYACLPAAPESQCGSTNTVIVVGAAIGTGLGTAAVYTIILVAAVCAMRRRYVNVFSRFIFISHTYVRAEL